MQKDILKIFLLLSVLVFISKPAQAQAHRIITLKQCIDSALVNYPSLQAFKKIEESKAANTKSLKSQLYPELDFSSQSQFNTFRDYNFRTFDNRLQFVWDMGNWKSDLQKYGITEEKIVRFQSRENKLNLIYSVRAAYFNLLKNKRTLIIAKQSVLYLKHLFEVNEKLYRLGQIKSPDYFATKSELLNAQGIELNAESEVENSRIELSKLTGIKIKLRDSLEAPAGIKFTKSYSVDSLIAEAEKSNPALQILNEQIKLEKIRTELIKNSRMPKFYLGSEYVFDNDPTSDGNYGVISGGVLIPVFDWGRRSNEIQSVRLKTESIKFFRKTLLYEMKAKLELLVNKISTVKNLLVLKSNLIKQSEKSYEVALTNYKAGILTNTDVLLAQKALTEAKASEEKLIFTLNEIEAQIENLVGKPEVK